MDLLEAKEFGIPEEKAKQISEQFKPMLDKMVQLEKEFNEIETKVISPEVCNEARELRLKLVKVRTGTAAIHKKQKSFYLQAGRFVDGWKNAQLFAGQGLEEKLDKIERYYQIKEELYLQKLSDERREELKPYVEMPEMIPSNLGNMNEDVYERYLSSIKNDFELREKAKKDVQEQHEEQQRKERERQVLKEERMTELRSKRLNGFASYEFLEELGGLSIEAYQDAMLALQERKDDREAVHVQKWHMYIIEIGLAVKLVKNMLNLQ